MTTPESGRRASTLPVGLVVMMGAACLLNFAWLSYDTTPPQWDGAAHLLSAMRFRELFASLLHGNFEAEGGFVELLWRFVHVNQRHYPPLFPLIAGLVSPGESLRSLIMVNSLFLMVLVFSVYQLGLRLHSRLAGLLSAALVLAYPIAFRLSRQFMLDYAVLAVTALSGCLLLASDEFRRPRATYLFGISAGLGMLTKPVYASFILAPALYTLSRVLIGARRPRERAARLRDLARLGLALLLGGLLASLWYVPNWRSVRAAMGETSQFNAIGFDVFDVNALTYYFNILVSDQIGLPFTALLIFGLVVLRRRLPPAEFGFLLSWLVGLYVLSTLAVYKGTRQDIAILVPVCLISGIAVAGLTRFRKSASAATFAFAAVWTLVLSLPFPELAERIGAFRWAVYYQQFPTRDDWQIEKALASLGGQPMSVWVMSDHVYVNGQTFKYYARSLGFPYRVTGRHSPETVDELLTADAIVVKTGWSPPGPNRGLSLRGVMVENRGVMYTQGRCDSPDKPNDPFSQRHISRDREVDARSAALENRRLIRTFPLPDGTELLVYR